MYLRGEFWRRLAVATAMGAVIAGAAPGLQSFQDRNPDTIKLHSSILSEERTCSIALPAGYGERLRGLRYVFVNNRGWDTSGRSEREGAYTPANRPAKWEWPMATPAEQGLNPKPLEELVAAIREGRRYPRLRSLLIIRGGHLVLEEYFGGYRGDAPHTLQSVSKSVTSALVGIAIASGEFSGVEERILAFFPGEKNIANRDPLKESIRLQDLLTMRSGTDYNENGSSSPHFQLNRLARGWDKFYLDRPMLRKPGTHFLYDSGGVILMSAMLKNRTGKHADHYAEEHLFKPLGIDRKSWFRNQEGHPHTGGGLHLLPRDMAKFGLMYLQNGRWQDRHIVGADWVHESTRLHVDFGGTRGRILGYGYLWWILAPDPAGPQKESIYAAMGFRAQYIFVIPEHDMVVVVNGDTRSGVDQRKPIDFLYTHILPSVVK
jgi:CubicO group peptidase (beta-lactamase class C family)